MATDDYKIYTTTEPFTSPLTTSAMGGSTITSTASYGTYGVPGAVWGSVNVPSYATPDDLNVLHKRLDQIEERLSIIKTDEYLMEKYPSLKEAYDAYKLIEALVRDNYGKSK